MTIDTISYDNSDLRISPASRVLRDWSKALCEKWQQWALCKLLIGPAPGVPDLVCDTAETRGSAEDKCKATLCVRQRSGLGAINNNKDK